VSHLRGEGGRAGQWDGRLRGGFRQGVSAEGAKRRGGCRRTPAGGNSADRRLAWQSPHACTRPESEPPGFWFALARNSFRAEFSEDQKQDSRMPAREGKKSRPIMVGTQTPSPATVWFARSSVRTNSSHCINVG